MCSAVNDLGTVGESAIQEDDALEKIFSECDVSSTGRVSVSTLIGYMRNHMSTQSSPKILKDLSESMRAASYDGEVTRKQYYDVSRKWLAKIRKLQHYQNYNDQDGNNNLHDDHYSVDSFNDDSVDDPPLNGQPGRRTRDRLTGGLNEHAEDKVLNKGDSGSESAEARTVHEFLDFSSSTVVDTITRCKIQSSFFGDLSSLDGTNHMAMDDAVFENAQDLRKRAHRCAVDNDHLKGELQRTEDSIATLERQLAATERKLELATSRCERLQKENDEQRELLAAAERHYETLETRNKRLERDNNLFRREIEATETEIRRLNADLDNANEQKEERLRLFAHCRQQLIEQQASYDEAKEKISQMKEFNDELQEKYDISTSTIEHLKIVVKELESQISELQPNQNHILRGEEVIVSPPLEIGVDGDMEFFPNIELTMPRSLHAEMQALGYAEVAWVDDTDAIETSKPEMIPEHNRNNNDYVDAIRCATDQLERATADLAVLCEPELVTRQSPESKTHDAIQKLSDQQVDNNHEHSPGTENLQRFNRQIRLTLGLFSLMVSRGFATTDIMGPANRLDQPDLVPAQTTATCNINANDASYANNNEESKSCPSCRQKSSTCYEIDATSTVETVCPADALANSTSPEVSPLNVSPTSCRSTGTPPSTSEPNYSPHLSPGYFYERSIIVPIVAALDEIIQGGGGTSSSEGDPLQRSPTELRREPNPRYIHTLPSGRSSELDYRKSPNAASPPSQQIPREVFDVRPSTTWRCQRASIKDDTSDDTYGAGSNQSQSSSEEDDCSLAVDLSGADMDIIQSSEYGAAGEIAGSCVSESKECQDEQATAPVHNQTLSDHYYSNVVEDLNLDLERLSLKSDIRSGRKHRTAHCNFHRQETTFDSRDCGRAFKRRPSLYRRSFAYRRGKLATNLDALVKRPVSFAHMNKHTSVEESSVASSSRRQGIDSDSMGYNLPPNDRHPPETDVTREASEPHAATTSASQSDQPPEREIGGQTHVGEFCHPPMADNVEPIRLRDSLQDSCETPSPRTPGVPSDSNVANWSSVVKPGKSEVSLGNGSTEKYVGSRAHGPSKPASTPMPSLPSNDEAPGVVVSANTAEQCSDVHRVSARSRSVACAMSSEEDSSDSECARDQIVEGENGQVVVAPLLPPLSSSPPLLSSPSSQLLPLSPPQRLMQVQMQMHAYPLPTSTPLPLPRQHQASLQLSTIEISSDYLLENPLPYEVNTSVRITEELSEDNSQCQFKNHKRLRRSLSESDCESCRGSIECRSRCSCTIASNRGDNKILRDHEGNAAAETAEDIKNQPSGRVFPNLSDARLIELGLAGPLNVGLDLCDRVGEDELEQKYTALSIGLGTDRVTLPQRLALSLRQRDQAERNLATEVERMQRDIQALAPLCVDRESVERVERVRHQLEMISRCALRVSCTAELLGATHQERRVSMAALLADRYLQALRARCDKLCAELAETKRVLAENNIVVEESPSELVDDVVSRVRYRGMPSTNRTTMTRRRASIATISRPATVNSLLEATKDNGRQHRTSVPTRMTLRRPSLSYDMQRWDNDKLDRTDSSSSSIGELREIFELAESRRGSREENNNLVHSQASNFSAGSCDSGDSDVWASTREDPGSFLAQAGNEQPLIENMFMSQRTPRILRTMEERIGRLPFVWYILFVAIFFFGFYSNRYVTSKSALPLKWWSVEEIIKRYTRVQHSVPPPI